MCPTDEGYYADPLNCMKFYICSEWKAQTMNCPVGKLQVWGSNLFEEIYIGMHFFSSQRRTRVVQPGEAMV